MQELVGCWLKQPLWQGGFFEMGLQGDRQRPHKREILLIELEKSLASNISPRTWGDHSLQHGSVRQVLKGGR